MWSWLWVWGGLPKVHIKQNGPQSGRGRKFQKKNYPRGLWMAPKGPSFIFDEA